MTVPGGKLVESMGVISNSVSGCSAFRREVRQEGIDALIANRVIRLGITFGHENTLSRNSSGDKVPLEDGNNRKPSKLCKLEVCDTAESEPDWPRGLRYNAATASLPGSYGAVTTGVAKCQRFSRSFFR